MILGQSPPTSKANDATCHNMKLKAFNKVLDLQLQVCFLFNKLYMCIHNNLLYGALQGKDKFRYWNQILSRTIIKYLGRTLRLVVVQLGKYSAFMLNRVQCNLKKKSIVVEIGCGQSFDHFYNILNIFHACFCVTVFSCPEDVWLF